MTRTLSTASKPASPTLVALAAVLAFAGAPGVATADVGIPLDSAVSQQYQAAEAVVEAAVQAPTMPAVPPVSDVAEVAPAAPAAAPPEEPRYHPDPAPQYQVNDAPSNSDFVSQDAPATDAAGSPPAAAEPPKPPAEDPRAPAPADEPPDPVDEPAKAVENVAALAGSMADVADVEDVTAASDVPAAELPALDSTAVAPTAPLTSEGAGSNVNVSIRIFSPGDDGPVTQVAGDAPVAPATSAPTTWIWNWDWSGGGGCDPGAAGNRAPPLGLAGWTWRWTWTCGQDSTSGALPGLEVLPEMTALVGIVPTFDSLPGLDSPIVQLPRLEGLTDSGSSPTKPAADAPESRAGRERPGTAGRVATHAGPPARVQASPVFAATPAAIVPGTARQLLADPRESRDIRRMRRLVPATTGAVGPPVAASAASAGAAGAAASGGGPGLLTTLVLVFLSFAAGALLVGVGLPRLTPPSSRLERPG